MQLEIIDLTTGKYPDLLNIVLNEEWAKGLIYCDMEGFFIGEDGQLILADECGNFAYCPHERFEVKVRFPSIRHLKGTVFTYEY